MTLFTRFSFHPIGQGIFSSGGLSVDDPIDTSFRWVYDCGTVKRWQKQLIQEVKRYASCCVPISTIGRPKLGLVFVSHFDLDHISGLVTLLQTFDVEALVLPYVPLWQRVVSAILSTRFDHPDTQAFFSNPVAFINRIEGARIRHIILVSPSDGQAGFGDDGDNLLPGGNFSNDQSSIRVTRGQTASPDNVSADEGSFFNEDPSGQKIFWLQPGGRILADGGWEFVPYNTPKLGIKATPKFRHTVRLYAKNLLLGSLSQRSKALAKLKSVYTSTFGTSPKKKNEISLFVYSGPTFNAHWEASVADYISLASGGANGQCSSGQCEICSYGVEISERPGILYTGDGYLSTANQLNSLQRFLGPIRMSSIGTIQVMHHGSRRNWRSGLASILAPLQSVFCADKRYTYHHPHREVWSDFEPFGAVLVDAKNGLTRFQVCR